MTFKVNDYFLLQRKNIIILIGLAALFTVFSLLIGCNTSVKSGVFHHSLHNYSINVPDDWIISQFNRGNHGDLEVSAILSEGIVIVPAITIAMKDGEGTLNDVIVWGENRIHEYFHNIDSYHLEDVDISNIGHHEVGLRKYEGTDEGGTFEFQDVYVLAENQYFVFSLGGEGELTTEELDTLFEVVNSFTIYKE